jgi:hypothetical protein
MLRKKLLLALLLVGLATFWAYAEEIALENILPPSTLSRYQKSDYPGMLKILRTAIQSTSNRLKIQVSRQDREGFLASLKELETLSEEAFDRSSEIKSEKMMRHKEVKRMEIFLRKEIDLLEDLKLEVPYDIRSSFQAPKESMDELRNKLFLQLFESAREFKTDLNPGAFSFSGSSPATAAPVRSAPTQGLHDIDRFTEEEFSSIQYARRLDDRIEVLLEIAESRIDEIDRRRKKEEWTEDEPNPLEFYTYEDLIHAYSRAMEAAMHSIDEHYERVLSPIDEIESALKDLEKGSRKFQKKLEEMEPLVKETGSLDLAMKLNKALKFTSTALEGTESGLESIRKRRE